MDEADEVAPRIAMLDRSERSSGALAGDGGQSPDLAQEWLESDPVFVNRPQLDGRLGEGGRDRAQQRAQSSLEVRLGLQISVDVPRAGQTQAGAETTQVRPAQLTTDWSRKGVGDPLCSATVRPFQRSCCGAGSPSTTSSASCCAVVNSRLPDRTRCRWSLTPSGPRSL
jgi:hypothetical protein